MFNSTIEIEIRWRFFSWSFFIHFLRSKAPSTVATEHSHVTLTVRAAMSFIHTIVDTARNQATAQPASYQCYGGSRDIGPDAGCRNDSRVDFCVAMRAIGVSRGRTHRHNRRYYRVGHSTLMVESCRRCSLWRGKSHWRWLMHHRLRVWLGYGFRVTRRDRLRCLSVFHRGSRTHGLFRFTHIQAEFNV